MSGGDRRDDAKDQPPHKCRTKDSWWKGMDKFPGHGQREPNSSSGESMRATMSRRQTASDSTGKGIGYPWSEEQKDLQQTDTSKRNLNSTPSSMLSETSSPKEDVKKSSDKPPTSNKTPSSYKQTTMLDFCTNEGKAKEDKKINAKSQVQVEAKPGSCNPGGISGMMDKTPVKMLRSEGLDSENTTSPVVKGQKEQQMEVNQAGSDCETKKQPVPNNEDNANGLQNNVTIDPCLSESRENSNDNVSPTEMGITTLKKHLTNPFSVRPKMPDHAGTPNAKSQVQRKDANSDGCSPASSETKGCDRGQSGADTSGPTQGTDTGGYRSDKLNPAEQASTSNVKGGMGSPSSTSYGTGQKSSEAEAAKWGNVFDQDSMDQSPPKKHSVTSPTNSSGGNSSHFNNNLAPGASIRAHGIYLPKLQPSHTHKVTVMLDQLKDGEKPRPFPLHFKGKWDGDHVRMPFSDQSVHQAQNMKDSFLRWEEIERSLLRDFKSSHDIEKAIKLYNPKYANQWNFDCLHTFFKKERMAAELLHAVVPKMAHLALALPNLCTMPLPLLRRDTGFMLTMSQEQAACLLANAFFCTFPRRNATGPRSEYSAFPDINFNRLFEGKSDRKLEKLSAIFHYFRQVCTKMPTGLLTFHRKKLETKVEWERSRKLLTNLKVQSTGTIETEGKGMLQVDFANKYVGGGVLGNGLVQEEIRFIINPELIVSRLFTEVLGPSECLIVTGTERFSNYTGYGDTFRCNGPHVDDTPRDSWMRRQTEIVAIDAIHFYGYVEQFEQQKLEREVNKAFCGFSCPDAAGSLPPVATGNWGCGAFGGDKRLKALLQMLAASEAGRDIAYFTFGDRNLEDDFRNIHGFLQNQDRTVGEVFKMLVQFRTILLEHSPHRDKPQLYEWLMHKLQK
uniref:poly(ADP-ribose) glycohydrolase n=1 Tax=Petromyzon marinus TaxID=7757 RepID=A0AAJ7TBU7_PETMA|nr:poly(ADP-ribose) glycohydrolase isoform X1 [Petromyzon marinus]